MNFRLSVRVATTARAASRSYLPSAGRCSGARAAEDSTCLRSARKAHGTKKWYVGETRPPRCTRVGRACAVYDISCATKGDFKQHITAYLHAIEMTSRITITGALPLRSFPLPSAPPLLETGRLSHARHGVRCRASTQARNVFKDALKAPFRRAHTPCSTPCMRRAPVTITRARCDAQSAHAAVERRVHVESEQPV